MKLMNTYLQQIPPTAPSINPEKFNILSFPRSTLLCFNEIILTLESKNYKTSCSKPFLSKLNTSLNNLLIISVC